MASTHFDAIIAGGGIVGTACARACAQAGMRVALVERDGIGSGATGAGMGHIVTMDDSEAQFALTRCSQILWQQLAAHLPADAQYERRGTLWIAADEEEMAEAERKHAYYSERGVPTNLLSAGELAEREPNLRPGLAGALYVPEDALVYAPAVALHLAREAQAIGAQLIVGRAITRMARGEAHLEDGAHLTAMRLVNATGTWATELGDTIPVKKRKGHVVITDGYPGFARHQLVELGYLKSAHSVSSDSVAFNVQPRSTGQLLIGSSRQSGNEDPAVDPHMLAAMLERAAHYMPALAGLSAIRVLTGFRAATPDNLPLIGPWPGDDTLWLGTGHEGLGITTALGTAEIVAAMFTGRHAPIPPEPYLPSRMQEPHRISKNRRSSHAMEGRNAGDDYGV